MGAGAMPGMWHCAKPSGRVSSLMRTSRTRVGERSRANAIALSSEPALLTCTAGPGGTPLADTRSRSTNTYPVACVASLVSARHMPVHERKCTGRSEKLRLTAAKVVGGCCGAYTHRPPSPAAVPAGESSRGASIPAAALSPLRAAASDDCFSDLPRFFFLCCRLLGDPDPDPEPGEVEPEDL